MESDDATTHPVTTVDEKSETECDDNIVHLEPVVDGNDVFPKV